MSDVSSQNDTHDLSGLTSERAAQLLASDGTNEIVEKRVSPLRKLLSYMWGPIPWMIEAAAILSAIAKDWSDFFIILAMLAVNAGVAFWQEHKADDAIALLKQKLATRARVLRDGTWRDLPARELVVGDVVHVKAGDVVPADVLLLDGTNLSVDQSALTGESLPADKRQGETAYSGCIVRLGEMTARVTATGMGTYFGKTAALVEGAGAPSHFQKAVLQIVNALIVATLLLIALVLTIAWLRDEPLMAALQFSLILAVAAIPVALPAVLSVTLAVGATVLSRGGAIVSRLAAIEELAGMDVLCSDKTGTLTQNHLTVGTPSCIEATDAEQVLFGAAIASERESNDAIDVSILAALNQPERLAAVNVNAFTPFDPVHKLTEAQATLNGSAQRISKGAPQAALDWAQASPEVRSQVAREVDALAADGYRTLAVAQQIGDELARVLGLLPLYDPPREDSAATLSLLGKLGVAVRMITGDHIAIARQIATRLGLGSKFATADEVFAGDHQPNAREILEQDGFAQVFPEHKYKIVQSLQSGGHLVGMTGDGVNDAPALR